MTTPAYSWTPLIVAHAVAAASAVGLGLVVLSRRKGNALHRQLGHAVLSVLGFHP